MGATFMNLARVTSHKHDTQLLGHHPLTSSTIDAARLQPSDKKSGPGRPSQVWIAPEYHSSSGNPTARPSRAER
jgi:hypothetical protein